MSKLINNLYKHQSLIYKVLLFLLISALVVYLFPKGSQFKYEYTKGKPWQYETLYAPFDFAIQKTDKELSHDRREIEENHSLYFDYDLAIADTVKAHLDAKIASVFADTILDADGVKLVKFAKKTLNAIYDKGVIKPQMSIDASQIVYLKRNHQAKEIVYKNLFNIDDLDAYMNQQISAARLDKYRSELRELFFELVNPNVSLDHELTQRDLQTRLAGLSYTKGLVVQGSRIISKGEVIDDAKLQVLNSLKKEYQSSVWNATNYYVIISGYALLVALALFMLFLFIQKYCPDIFENNKSVTFVFSNVLLVVAMTVGVLKMNPDYIYAVPICILPITLKAFFDTRLGLFVHIITVLILGFIVPNSYEYMFLQIMAGIVTIISFTELYKRANLFISVGKITLIYIVAYFAFTAIQEGSFSNLNGLTVLMFFISGVLTLFVQPLIYAYEKIFGLISDMSLLELSNTNSKLLKELSNKAPGTFHHSLNVANLAEAAANEIGANAMLVRVGALHHDIGKMINPTFFTENQIGTVNPHDELPPEESAHIIINHVIYGIEMAKNNNLPDRIIDFIRTHHGMTTVYYFYKKAVEAAQETGIPVDIKNFQYPGPRPFSKETAILMMSDSVEAASKSLKNPTAQKIDEFVEKIIDKQMKDGQFLNASITFKEIQSVKKILKRKLNNIYHLRVEYPE